MAFRILVIDDESDVVKYLQSVLTDNGYDVKYSLEGETGYDIILTGIEKGERFDFHKWVGDDTLKAPEKFLEKPIKVDDFLKIVAALVVAGKVNSK